MGWQLVRESFRVVINKQSRFIFMQGVYRYMGKLKFRAFRKSDSIMFDNLIGFTIHDNGFISLYLKDSVTGKELEEYYTRADEFVIMQSTGLNDKNGKEIYEGDIVKVNTFKGVKKGTVIFKNACFWALVKEFNTVSNVLFPLHDNEKYTKFQVIGNMYENSELLEVV